MSKILGNRREQARNMSLAALIFVCCIVAGLTCQIGLPSSGGPYPSRHGVMSWMMAFNELIEHDPTLLKATMPPDVTIGALGQRLLTKSNSMQRKKFDLRLLSRMQWADAHRGVRIENLPLGSPIIVFQSDKYRMTLTRGGKVLRDELLTGRPK